MELGVALSPVGETLGYVMGNGLEECLGCMRNLALGEWSQGLQPKVVRSSGTHKKSNRLCVGGKMCGVGMCVCGGEFESETVLELPPEMSGVPP